MSSRRRDSRFWGSPSINSCVGVILSTSVTAIIFSQGSAPSLFAVAPVLLLVTLRAPLRGTIMALVGCVAIALAATLIGVGPHAGADLAPAARLYLLEGFIASLLFVVLPVWALVGERDRLGGAIARSERLFARLAEASPAGTIHFDPSGRPIFANQRWTELTGLGRDALVDERWLESIAPVDRSAAISLWARARATLEPCTGEFLFVKDGEAAGNAELNLYPEVEDGKVLGFVARLTDVTARRRAERTVQEREECYRLVTENARDVILRLGLDGRPFYASGASLRVTGYAPAELVGRPIGDLIHRDDLPVIERSLARMAEGITDTSIEFRLRHRHGHFSWFESSQRVVFDRDGQPIEVVASLRDIEIRRRSEATAADAAAQLRDANRLLVMAEELAGVGHWYFGPREGELDCSPQIDRILNQKRGNRLRADSIMGIVDDADRRPLLACLARSRRTRRTAECAIRVTARGEPRHVRLVAQARYHDQEFAGWFGVVGDVTDGVVPHCMNNPGDAIAPDQGKLEVLIAEDNRVHQRLIAAIVQRLGHKATLAENGREAVDAAMAHHFDAILMDMQMPEMDGLAATRAIRSSGGPCATTAIIALTADASLERRRFYDGAGLTGFLTKPIDRTALVATLSAIESSADLMARRSPATAAAASFDAERIEELRASLGMIRVEALLALLINECLERPAQLRSAFVKGELFALKGEAHCLKGAAISMGAVALGQAAQRLEAIADLDLAEPLLIALEENARTTLMAAQRLLSAPNAGRALAWPGRP